VKPSSGVATFTFVGLNATVTTSGGGSALAQDAHLTFTAYNPHVTVPGGTAVEQWNLSL
jgi:hypothetical protein